jgi:REP element-mobilizing transposase RayT
MQNLRTGRQVAYDPYVHLALAFVLKYCCSVVSALALGGLAAIFAKVYRDFVGADAKQGSGENDHVHLLVTSPTATTSTLVNRLTGVSSRPLRERRPEISRRDNKGGVLWSAYLAGSCEGAAPSRIAESIRSQRKAAPSPRPEGRGIGRGN